MHDLYIFPIERKLLALDFLDRQLIKRKRQQFIHSHARRTQNHEVSVEEMMMTTVMFKNAILSSQSSSSLL